MIPENDRRIRRFFAPSASLRSGEIVALPADEAHHALHVLRLKVGDAVEVFDGAGLAAGAVVAAARRGEVQIEVQTVRVIQREGPVVHLAFAVPKGKRLDWLLEKATELGAASLTPLRLARSIAGADELSEHQLVRWRAHCISAAKQSGLCMLPSIRPAASLDEYLAFCKGKVSLVGHAGNGAMTIWRALSDSDPSGETCILVGPEGGLTEAELKACIDAGSQAVKLGASVLRTETAALALLSAVMSIERG